VRPGHLAGLAALAAPATWVGVTDAAALAEALRHEPVADPMRPRIVAGDVAEEATVAILRAAGITMMSGPAADAA
jgi:hypothetical protein